MSANRVQKIATQQLLWHKIINTDSSFIEHTRTHYTDIYIWNQFSDDISYQILLAKRRAFYRQND